jgi:D-sedoheptulose 7-phosphate isomerase
MNFIQNHIDETIEILNLIDIKPIEEMVKYLHATRNRGRLFILGVGGGAAHASHAVNDFRKLCNIEAYAPSDNVSELTARTNDEGWDTTYVEWLRTSQLRCSDAVLVISVGGGNLEKNVSPNLIKALDYAKSKGAAILGIVGRDGGYTAQLAHVCVIVPTVNTEAVTPHTEAIQAVVWHLIVSHPKLAVNIAKWEGTT